MRPDWRHAPTEAEARAAYIAGASQWPVADLRWLLTHDITPAPDVPVGADSVALAALLWETVAIQTWRAYQAGVLS